MAKDDMIEVDGKVVEALPNATFKVEIANGKVVLCRITPYSVDKGRIVYRNK